MPSVVKLSRLFTVGLSLLALAAILSVVFGPRFFGLRPASEFHSDILSVQSLRDGYTIEEQPSSEDGTLFIEWKTAAP